MLPPKIRPQQRSCQALISPMKPEGSSGSVAWVLCVTDKRREAEAEAEAEAKIEAEGDIETETMSGIYQ